MKIMYALAAAIATLLSSSALAATQMVRCDYCDAGSAPQFARNLGIGEFLVVNPTQPNSTWKFSVERHIIGDECYVERADPNAKKREGLNRSTDCQTEWIAIPVDASAAELDLGIKYHAAYNFTGGTMKTIIPIDVGTINIPPNVRLPSVSQGPGQAGGPLTAADLVNNINIKDHLTALFSSSFTSQLAQISVILQNPVSLYVAATEAVLASQLMGGDATEITFQVVCADGSYAEFTLTLSNRQAQLTDAKDSDGRTLMTADNMAQFNGFRHTYATETAANTFANNLTFLGGIVYGGASGGSEFVCWTSGSTVTCRRIH
jgi:hypothetical protein